MEQTVTLFSMDENLNLNYEPFKNALLKYPQISGVSVGYDLPTTIQRKSTTTKWDGQHDGDRLSLKYTYVDYDFFQIYDMQIIQGRNFSAAFITDKNQAAIINETAVRKFGWEEPLGMRFEFQDNEWTVIGVVKDFHYKSLHTVIMPLVIRLNRPWSIDYFSIKIGPDNISSTLTYIEKKWNEFSPGYPFEFSFLDESIDKIYKTEHKLGQCFNYFTLIAIFIACLGLFGMASFTSERRTKEFGIRKVLGASISGITFLLSRELTKWVLVANIIAWPVAYFAMNKWLQNFAYRVNLNIWQFILAGFLSLMIALLTVGYPAVKAGMANPVEALKYE